MKKNIIRTELRPVVINKTFSDAAIIAILDNNNQIGTTTRSAGDGMDSLDSKKTDTPLDGYSGSRSGSMSDFPQTTKRKEPKFVPYEPYKAAVNPIVPENETGKSKRRKAQPSLTETHIPFPLMNNPTSAPLIRVLRDIPRESSKSPSGFDCYQIEKEQWEEERIQFEEEISKLKLEKREIENQFKVQTQVNAELKKLLVASMGEDMQTRVQFLSEDKVRLAQDITHYTKMLQDEHEEMEKLAIQCDIWRSKFLACSLMVDELAGWKALLSRRYEESKEVIQWLLDERTEMKQNVLNTQRFLKQLQRVFDPASSMKLSCKANNILTLVQSNCSLADSIHYRLLGATKRTGSDSIGGTSCEGLTPAEDVALRVLATKEVITDSLNASDDNRTRHHTKMCRFHAHSGRADLSLHACRHCSGDIDVV